MAVLGRARFHAEFKAALGDHKQRWLAERLDVTESMVSRWARGSTRPMRTQVESISRLLDAPQLLTIFDETNPAFELYLAAPISGLDAASVAEHHDVVARIAAAAAQVTNGVYWPGRDVHAMSDLAASDIATRDNLEVLSHCDGLLYVQLSDVAHPTGALVELGIALGRRIKTTIMVRKDLPLPFMLRNFEGVAARSQIMPDARVDFVEDVDEVIQRIERNGREIFGLS